jgi:hypothetical protein
MIERWSGPTKGWVMVTAVVASTAEPTPTATVAWLPDMTLYAVTAVGPAGRIRQRWGVWTD